VSGDLRLPENIETIPAALAFWADRTPGATALRSLEGRALSHRELYRATAVVVARLRALGVGPGDRVALMLPPGFDYCLAMMGAMSGAVAVPLPFDATDRERARDLERLPPRLVVTGGAEAERVDEVAARLGIATVAADDLCDWSRIGLMGFLAAPEIAPERTAVILHTSGTTGLPKRVPRSHRALIVGSRAVIGSTGLTPDDVLLLASGLHNISALGNLLNALLSGGCCLAAPGLDPVAFGGWLEEGNPTWTFLTPTHLRLILETAAALGRERVVGERSRLRLVRAGTQPLPPATRMHAEQQLGATILDTYGMTEAHSITAWGPGGEEQRDGSVGKPLAVSLRIIDENGEDVPSGTLGAIVVRGPTVMDGYLDDPEASAAVFIPDGWFRTGDLGYLDADGFLFIVGRAKTQINRGGEQIAPEEIDLILQEHPAVAEAAAFAVPDARLGEDVVAAVVLRPGMIATAREMRAFLLDRLAPPRAPRRIWFVERLPRTVTGKVQRSILGEQFLGEEDGVLRSAGVEDIARGG
jgi:acyl-CoA synthetase (AMP-forming)/AMP-acid ligase II